MKDDRDGTTGKIMVFPVNDTWVVSYDEFYDLSGDNASHELLETFKSRRSAMKYAFKHGVIWRRDVYSCRKGYNLTEWEHDLEYKYDDAV